jgi:hypothetical protein
MRAWTVDADDIRVAEDFDESFLHHTPEIDSFLNLDRDDKFIVVATKGFGKTLLLKAKRILYQRDGRATCLPVGNLLDKPIGEVQTRRQASDGSHTIAGGDGVLCAARIEPHVEPGQIWASEEFRQQLALTPSLWRTTLVPGRATTSDSTSRRRPSRTCGCVCTASNSDDERCHLDTETV